jgi:release factor glutamine methyltransferase
MKIKKALETAYKILKDAQVETYILDAQILLSYVLKVPRWKIIVDQNKELGSDKYKKFIELVNIRQNRVPIAYITHQKEFFGYNFYIEEGVLIPRPETELLVEIVLNKIKNMPFPIGIDVGSGSGAICLTLLKEKKDLTMICTDISQKAINITKKNAKLLNVEKNLKIIRTDILKGINTKVDFIVSNPPYICETEYKTLQPEVKREPKEALVAKKDGIFFYEEIIKQGKNLIKEGGFFAFEVGYNQSRKVSQLLTRYGFKTEIYKDIAGIERIIVGEK